MILRTYFHEIIKIINVQRSILLLEYSSINSKTSHDSGTYMERALLIQSLVNVLPIQDNLFDLNVRNKLVLVKKQTYGGI